VGVPILTFPRRGPRGFGFWQLENTIHPQKLPSQKRLLKWVIYTLTMDPKQTRGSSVGYGDITPLHPFARSLADIEAIIGQLYPATLLARLVTLELEHRRAT